MSKTKGPDNLTHLLQQSLAFLKGLKTDEPYSDRELELLISDVAKGLSSSHTITIEIRDGALIDVRGLPDNWFYRLIDHDIEGN